MKNEDELIDRKEAAKRLGLKPKTLQEWGRLKKGIPYIKVGGSCKYRLSDVESYLAKNTVRAGS